jgi:amphi-Trp domain-containing protein
VRDSSHDEQLQLSRQQAAELMTDIAYALTTGGRLRLDGDDEIELPAGDRITLTRRSRTKSGRVQLGIELSWAESP